MRFRLYREYGALNSAPIFDAFEKGLLALGHQSVKSDDAIPVIWSVLWAGRMAPNRKIYHHCRKNNLPIVIIEVGNLKRNDTWRISLNHVNSLGYFGNDRDLDAKRPQILGINLRPLNNHRQKEILIATQHEQSLQWEGMGSINEWVGSLVREIKTYTDRKIKVRPHPRATSQITVSGVEVEVPKKLPGSYDAFDINYAYHCVINHNSGPAIQAAINGTPVICNASSLAGELSGKLSEIENISLPDRSDWFLRLCHTEWTVEEIAKGIPLRRLEQSISENNR